MTHFGPTKISSATAAHETKPQEHTAQVAPLEGTVTNVQVSLLRQAIMRGAHFLGLSNDLREAPSDAELDDNRQSTQTVNPSMEEVPSHRPGLLARAWSFVSNNTFSSTLFAVGEWASHTWSVTLEAITTFFRTFKEQGQAREFDAHEGNTSSPIQVGHLPDPKAVTNGSSAIILDVIQSKQPTDQDLLRVATEQTVEAYRREQKEAKTEQEAEMRERQTRLDDARRLILEIDHRCGSTPNNPAVAQVLASLDSPALDPIEPIEHAIARAIREVEMLQLQENTAEDPAKKQDT